LLRGWGFKRHPWASGMRLWDVESGATGSQIPVEGGSGGPAGQISASRRRARPLLWMWALVVCILSNRTTHERRQGEGGGTTPGEGCRGQGPQEPQPGGDSLRGRAVDCDRGHDLKGLPT